MRVKGSPGEVRNTECAVDRLQVGQSRVLFIAGTSALRAWFSPCAQPPSAIACWAAFQAIGRAGVQALEFGLCDVVALLLCLSDYWRQQHDRNANSRRYKIHADRILRIVARQLASFSSPKK